LAGMACEPPLLVVAGGLKATSKEARARHYRPMGHPFFFYFFLKKIVLSFLISLIYYFYIYLHFFIKSDTCRYFICANVAH
jgi:hypothetical protein